MDANFKKIVRAFGNCIILLNLIPVLSIYTIIFPLYLLDSSYSIMPLTNILSSTFLIPLLLSYLNYRYVLIRGENLFIVNILLMVISVIASQFFSYAIWGISSGNFYNPDSETVLISKLSFKISLIIVVGTGILIQSILIYRHIARRSR